MDNEANVALVNPHAEGHCRYDDLDLVLHPHFLYLIPLVVPQTGVIEHAGNPVPLIKLVPDALAFLLSRAIYDSGLLETLLFDEMRDITDITPPAFLPDLIEQIRPIEGTLEIQDIGHLQIFRDVLLHHFRSSGREGHRRDRGEALLQGTELHVISPEIPSPLRNAMCLINHKPIQAFHVYKIVEQCKQSGALD